MHVSREGASQYGPGPSVLHDMPNLFVKEKAETCVYLVLSPGMIHLDSRDHVAEAVVPCVCDRCVSPSHLHV